MTDRRRSGSAGFTFAELAFGLLILVVTSAVLINHLTLHLRSSESGRDQLFGMSKAQAILNEMQSFVEKALPGDSGDLDSLDDGIVNKATLTIAHDNRGRLVAPDDVLSGNIRQGNGWLWSRRITVQPFPGAKNRNVRYSTVRIFKKDGNGIDRVVAELSAVVNAPGTAFPTTQVFDLYLIAIENIPGWWVFMDSIKPFVESTITDLETRNPGLEVRTHWITKSSFGRNPVYRPFFNEASDSLAVNDHLYFYPSKMPAGSASTYYYVPASVRAHIDLDGVDEHGYDSDRNPFPYTLCDYWNHAMRLPEEQALWQLRKAAVEAREAEIAAATAAGTAPPEALDDMSKEPTLRLFLEDLNTNPAKYKNALIINLHGELLPLPALRNYSDAAKDPVRLQNVRVVTHPEQLRTLRDPAGTTTESVALRVYAYNTYEPTYSGPQIMPYPIAVEVMGMDLTDSTTVAPDLRAGVTLKNMPGGVTVGSSNAYPSAPAAPDWGFQTAKVLGDPSLVSNEMHYEAHFVVPGDGTPSFTRILLYNTPCVATQVNHQGIANARRSQLYRMSYVPSPCEAARDFSRNLATADPLVSGVYQNVPKNTARWRLVIPKTAFTVPMFADQDGHAVTPTGDQMLTVRTRIWTDSNAATSGTMWPSDRRNAPENLSTTYTWWADSPEDVPITERSQFQGDPRHCPYKDLFNNDTDFPNGYNWYFDSLNKTAAPAENSVADYPAINTADVATLWRGRMNIDVPRFLQMFRQGLQKSNCVYTTLTGFSYYYLGVGNDIGYDSANGYANSIPTNQVPFGSSGNGFTNTILTARTLAREGAAGTAFWYSMPWLGEIYPDSVVSSQWLQEDANHNPRGNLTAGTGANHFYQASNNTVYTAASTRQAYGLTMANSLQMTSVEGCTSLFNIGTSTSSFHHTSSSGTGSLTTTGTELASNYNFHIPTTAPISRPFGLTLNATVGTEWSLVPYSVKSSASLYKTYFTHPTGQTGAGLVKLVDPANANAAYVVVNGFDRTVESGSTFIAKWAVLSLIHSYFEAGKTSNTLRIKQPARVEIRAPTDISELIDPDQIDIVLKVDWKRWDGLPYAATGTYAESEGELRYVLTYSNDGGATWRYIQDDSPAVLGEPPSSAGLIVADGAPGDETVAWRVPETSFPQGSYYLRVECYRAGASIHYSYHQTKLFIKR